VERLQGEVNREKAAAATAEWASDPATVAEIYHAGFNADEQDGGLAFACDRGLVIFAFDGGTSWSIDPGGYRQRAQGIEAFWRENQHRNRSIALDDLNEWHRAAVATLVAGLDSVGQLPELARVGITNIARADYIYVCLRRHARSQTQEDSLRALAANDWIMEMDGDGDTAHPCPICGRPAIGRAWQYNTICDECYSKPVCREGHRVDGYNTSLGGGFEAAHLDDKSVCDQVTRDGAVWIDGVECHMGEAKFGGVFVGIAPAPE
jgi:hypothetical protein